ncbi:MAG TPA: amidohydrolase family protein [Streptosporangiaceae bacterium]|nr:amidohydrolase family protein [Streptosporangiaceae bacterium]
MTKVVFAGGQVFDGSGSEPAAADVVMEHGRIVDVGIGLDGDEAVDCTGRTVLPGMFDCHVHLTDSTLNALEWESAPFSLQFYQAVRNMELTLATGVTTVRDACGADLGIQVAQRRGLVRGPRMQISIAMISQTGGHGDRWQASGCPAAYQWPHPGRPEGVADGPEQVRAKVREMIRAGADVIKIATTGGVFSPRDDPRHAHFRDTEIAVAVEEAAAAGCFVMAHAQGNAGIKSAIRGGVRSVEHGIFLDEEAIEMMVDHGTWLVPTLTASLGVREAIKAGVPIWPEAAEKERIVAGVAEESVRAAAAAGVKIAMGTDAPVYPHGKNLRELELLVRAGLTPAQALHAATLSAARLMGLDGELGTLEPGKVADLVIADGDALGIQDLGGRIRAVYQNGVLVSGHVQDRSLAGSSPVAR